MNTRLSVTPHARDPFTVIARIIGYDGQATLHWGDGSAPTHTMPGRSYDHTFPAIGRYMATCVDGSGVMIARQQISVTGSTALDEVRVSEDDAGIRLAFGEIDPRLGVSYYRVEWQDGEVEHVWGVPGRSVRHDATPGLHEVKIVDINSGRNQKWSIDVTDGPCYDPEFTVHRWSGDETGMTVYVKITKVQAGRPIHIWWDDADGPQLVDRPTLGIEIPHIYTFPGHYMQTVAYAGEPSFARSKSEAITVPATESTRGRKFRELVKNQASTFEEPAPKTAFAQRISRLGSGSTLPRPGLLAGRPRGTGAGSSLAIGGKTGVEETFVDDPANSDPAVDPARENRETTTAIDHETHN